MDPSDPQTVYFGTYRVWRTTNQAGSWSAISGDLTGGGSGSFGTVTTIAVAPTDPDVVYAGTDDSHVWVTKNGGANWTDVSGALPDRWCTRVAVDPTDADIAYVTFSGLRWDENIGYVYRTDDAGATWTDITGNLPGAPVNALIVDPEHPTFSTSARTSAASSRWTWERRGTSWARGCRPSRSSTSRSTSRRARWSPGTHGRSIHSIDLNDVTGVPDGGDEVQSVVSLGNHPNPFGRETTIAFTLEPQLRRHALASTTSPGAGCARSSQRTRAAGEHEIRWDGRNEAGRAVANGTYFLRLEAGGEVTAGR